MQIFHVNVCVLRKNYKIFTFYEGKRFFRVRDWKVLSKGPLLRVAGRRAQIWYYAIMQNLMWYEGADGFVFSLTALSYFLLFFHGVSPFYLIL